MEFSRMIKSNAMRLLDAAGIPYEAVEYPTEDGRIDAISVAEKIGRPVEQTFKTLVAEAPGREYFVFVIPASSELDLKKAARAADRKSIELIPLKQLFPLTGYMHGGCSPIGMKKQFQTFLDETAILFDPVCVSGGRVGLNLALNPEALAGFIRAGFADLVK